MQRRKLPVRIMIVFIAFAFFLCACQPTPDAPIVNAGDDTDLNGKIEATPIPTPETPEENLSTIYNFPTEYKDEFECLDTNVSITVDAEIIVPDVQSVPVVEVEPINFSPEYIKSFTEKMHPGVTFYDDEAVLLKSDAQRYLENYQEQAAMSWDEFLANYKNGDESSAWAYYEQCKAMVEEYKKLLPTLPETHELSPTDFTYHTLDHYLEIFTMPETWYRAELYGDSWDDIIQPERQFMWMAATTEDNLYIKVFIEARLDEDVKSSLTYRLGTDLINGGRDTQWEPARVGEMTIGKSEAIALGNEAIENLGLENEMMLSKINAIDYYGKVISDGKEKVLTYKLIYHRGFNGLVAGNVYIENDYAYVVGNEEIIITIQSDRVVELEYNNPYETTNVENENVGLISFEQAYEAFKKQARIEFTLRNICSTPSDVDQGLVDHCDLTIAEIQFLMVRIPIKNGGYRYVPAWQFRGKVAEYYKDGDVYDWVGYSNIYMTINAVDGTIID